MGLLITIVWILIVITCAVLAYYLIIWVLQQLGITIPPNILKVILVLLVLIVIYLILTGGFARIAAWGA